MTISHNSKLISHNSASALVERLLRGERTAASRLMTIMENRLVGYHEVLSLLMPHVGRADVQALKAGVLELADVLLINKADREGADRLANQLKTAMRLAPLPKEAWTPPIVKTVAVEGKGIEELAAAIERHRAYLMQSGRLQRERRARLRTEVLERARDLILRRLTARLEKGDALDRLLDALMAGQTDPASAARALVDEGK